MVFIKYKCPYLAAAWLRAHSCWNTGQQMYRLLLSSKRRPCFQTHKWSWKEQEFGHGSRRGPKPNTTVLARTSSNLLHRLSPPAFIVVPRSSEKGTGFGSRLKLLSVSGLKPWSARSAGSLLNFTVEWRYACPLFQPSRVQVCLKAGCHDWGSSWLSSAPPSNLKLYLSRFLTHPFQFTDLSSCDLTLNSASYCSVVK
jgi:hypothetical protein